MIVHVGGVRCYQVAGGIYPSVSACLDLIHAQRYLPDGEHLERGTRLHYWTTEALAGRPVEVLDEFQIEYEHNVTPVLDWFKKMQAVIHSVETVGVSSARRIAGRPDVTCSLVETLNRHHWIIDLKFCESLIERYEFQLHGYRLFDDLRGYRMGILQMSRNGRLRFVEVHHDSNKTSLVASAACLLHWQSARAARDLTEAGL